MSAAPQRRAATRRVRVASWRIAALAATCLAAGLSAGCADSMRHPPPEPTPAKVFSLRATARAAAPAHEHAVAARHTVAAPSGPAGRGALARRLPLRFHGWQLSIAQLSARHGAYLVTTLPPAGRRATPATAARLLRAAARTLADDPRTYRPLLPMSALAGAHRKRRTPVTARAEDAAYR